MLKWIKTVLSGNKPKKFVLETQLEPIVIGYNAFFDARLNQLAPKVEAAFNRLSDAISENVAPLHIEVFLDEPGFNLYLSTLNAVNCETLPDKAVTDFNSSIEALWPFMTEDELDKFTIWEADPRFGKTVALDQPIDGANELPRIVDWLRKTSEACRKKKKKKKHLGHA